VFVQGESGEVLVFEIPERLFEVAQEIESSPCGGPGVVLSIVREGKAKNSRVEVVVVGYEPADELDIGRFVSTLGRIDL
jgi:hypothetical protein